MSGSEFSLIYRYFASLGMGPGIDLGVGDDCAVVTPLPDTRIATSVDTMVEGVHFLPDTFPEDIAFRAVATAVSDLAAMGASPTGMTLALTLPDADDLWLHAFSQGLAQAVSAFSIPLIGGDTTRGPLTITVQVLGCLPLDRGLLRSGAQPGDLLYVSGTLGDAAAGLACLQGEWQPAPAAQEFLTQRYLRPAPPLQLGQQLLGLASAAIDISDGLLADAGHVADASGVEITINSATLPLSAALQSHPSQEQALQWARRGGDDYELCFTLGAQHRAPAGCTAIGRVAEGAGVVCDIGGPEAAGYQHF